MQWPFDFATSAGVWSSVTLSTSPAPVGRPEMHAASLVFRLGSRAATRLGSRAAAGLGSRAAMRLGSRAVVGLGTRAAMRRGSRVAMRCGSRAAAWLGSRAATRLGSRAVTRRGSRLGSRAARLECGGAARVEGGDVARLEGSGAVCLLCAMGPAKCANQLRHRQRARSPGGGGATARGCFSARFSTHTGPHRTTTPGVSAARGLLESQQSKLTRTKKKYTIVANRRMAGAACSATASSHNPGTAIGAPADRVQPRAQRPRPTRRPVSILAGTIAATRRTPRSPPQPLEATAASTDGREAAAAANRGRR